MTTSSSKIAGKITGWNRVSAISSAILWLLLLLPLPGWFDLPVESGGETRLIERLLLLAILVFTPLTLRLTANQNFPHPWPWRAAVLIQLLFAIVPALKDRVAQLLLTNWVMRWALFYAVCWRG